MAQVCRPTHDGAPGSAGHSSRPNTAFRALLVAILSCVAVLRPSAGCFAGRAPWPAHSSITLADTVREADAVVLARIEAFSPPAEDRRGKPNCRVRVLECIKGTVAPPEVMIWSLGAYPADPRLPMAEKEILVFLEHHPGEEWREAAMGGEYVIPDERPRTYEKQVGAPWQRLVGLVLDTAQVPGYGKVVGLLLGTIDRRIIPGLSALSESPDLQARDQALTCMLQNGDLTTIPKIVKLSHTVQTDPTFWLSVPALHKITSRAAVPYFNRMLLNWDDGLRITAVNELRFSLPGGQSSIPYLVLALHDSEDQVAYQAYASLSKLAPELGPSDDTVYWARHKRSEIERILSWWRDELNGKNRDVPDAAAQAAEIRAMDPSSSGDKREVLQLALFSPAIKVRSAAITALGHAHVTADTPYLMLALEDPDVATAFKASEILRGMLKTPGPAPTAEQFGKHRMQDAQPLWDWWHAELRGDHTTNQKLRDQLGLPDLPPPPKNP